MTAAFQRNENLLIRRIGDVLLKVRTEVLNPTQYRRRGRITQRAKRTARNIARHIDKHIGVAGLALIMRQTAQNAH